MDKVIQGQIGGVIDVYRNVFECCFYGKNCFIVDCSTEYVYKSCTTIEFQVKVRICLQIMHWC